MLYEPQLGALVAQAFSHALSATGWGLLTDPQRAHASNFVEAAPRYGLDVALGKGEPGREPIAGIALHGRASELPLGDWNALFAHGGGPVQGLPLAFDLQVDTLTALGQRFSGVRLKGSRTGAKWEAKAKGFDYSRLDEMESASMILDRTGTVFGRIAGREAAAHAG